MIKLLLQNEAAKLNSEINHLIIENKQAAPIGTARTFLFCKINFLFVQIIQRNHIIHIERPVAAGINAG